MGNTSCAGCITFENGDCVIKNECTHINQSEFNKRQNESKTRGAKNMQAIELHETQEDIELALVVLEKMSEHIVYIDEEVGISIDLELAEAVEIAIQVLKNCLNNK